MKNDIKVLVYDYSPLGGYTVVRSDNVDSKELVRLRQEAARSVRPGAFDNLPSELTHIVYYGDIRKNDDITFAAVYMHGEAMRDAEFDRIAANCKDGYVGAYHRR